MKIIFWFVPQTALMVILAVGAVSPVITVQGRDRSVERRSESSALFQNVSKALEESGLERDAAEEKVYGLFAQNTPNLDVQFDNLTNRPELDINRDSLVRALSKRALYDRKIDLADYHSLTGLVHEIKGHALCDIKRQAVLEVSLQNQAV